MSTLPIDICTSESEAHNTIPTVPLKEQKNASRAHSITFKRGQTVINSKKLPKDFFSRDRIDQTRTAKKIQRISDSPDIERTEKPQKRDRKIIS